MESTYNVALKLTLNLCIAYYTHTCMTVCILLVIFTLCVMVYRPESIIYLIKVGYVYIVV